MAKVVSEDAVRRALSKIEAEAGRSWLQEQLDYCTRPLLREPWILDVDTWRDAGADWQGKHGEIRLMGWSRQRRVVVLRRRLAGVMIDNWCSALSRSTRSARKPGSMLFWRPRWRPRF